ncbi:MAG: hypothetical protein ABI703_10865 [Gemmatimonadales bacterium]
MNRPGERIAAIDVGSNSVKLTVAEYDPGAGLVVIEEAEDRPRLGAGLARSGRLGDTEMRRAIESLARMREICRRHGVTRVAAVGTAALREAANGAEFVARVRELDIPLRMILPETEAALAYRSAAYHFPGSHRTLVADIGGGSLELIGAENGAVTLSHSLPLGAVKLTELELPLAELGERIRRELEPILPASEWRGSRVIGLGGTFVTLGSMMLARPGPSSRPLHGITVTTAEVHRLMSSLAALRPEQRRQVAGLHPQRADIIVAGSAVAAELLEAVDAADVRVSGFGLRDGLLLEMVGLE